MLHTQQEVTGYYRKGDRIGEDLVVCGTLGKGGFGIVYLVCDRWNKLSALKTFRDELLGDASSREAFKQEALVWVNVDSHPHILKARFIFAFAGRLFVHMDYIPPDDQGRVNLGDHLAVARRPLPIEQASEWALQFCLGMEHINSRGITCHRDIKPSNILIARDGKLKITDFGLAAAIENAATIQGASHKPSVNLRAAGQFSFSLVQTHGRRVCGTPGYIAPEVYRGEGTSIRSDVYSFGCVLWQMATGCLVPPFVAACCGEVNAFLREIYECQMKHQAPSVDSAFMPVLSKCLERDPERRFRNFADVRFELERVFRKRGQINVQPLQTKEDTAAIWHDKGASLQALRRHEEAIKCFDKALAENSLLTPSILCSKAGCLNDMRRYQEALRCCENIFTASATTIDRLDKVSNQKILALAWFEKGRSLMRLGQSQEALNCFDGALLIEPQLAVAWGNKAYTYINLEKYEEALRCIDRALAINPRQVILWSKKADLLSIALGQREEALRAYAQALAIDPLHAMSWKGKAMTEDVMGRYGDAQQSYRKFIELAADQDTAAAQRRLQELKEVTH
jgi:serine/threonine protein kinase